jgi:hypothetical protein
VPSIAPTAAPIYDDYIYTEYYFLSTCLDSSSSSTASLSAGAIAGIVIGSIAFVAVIAYGIWYYLFKYRLNYLNDKKAAADVSASSSKNPLSSPINTL